MKKMKIMIIIALVSQLSIFAQSGWNLVYTNSQGISSIYFKNHIEGFAYLGTSGLYNTTDGGESWSLINISNLNSNITKIISLGNNTLIGISSGGTIIKSIDGGSNWTAKSIGTSDHLTSICTTVNGKLFVSSVQKNIYESTDNGDSWNIYSIDTMYHPLTSISFSNSEVGYGVGYYDTSIKTTDGGATWFTIPSIVSGVSMFKIKFINKNEGYVLGGDEIVKTTDGGNTWKVKYSAGGLQLNDISTYGDSVAWVVGTTDKIFKTTNAGETWISQSFSPYHNLTAASCVDKLTCYAISSDGYMYKTIDGGSLTGIQISSEHIMNYRLLQNYPNPFNPTTTINYQVPSPEFVSLKVYDILGRKMATLVNEEKPAGSYEVEFNGSALSGGIYLYKIQAGNYSSMKKMILLK